MTRNTNLNSPIDRITHSISIRFHIEIIDTVHDGFRQIYCMNFIFMDIVNWVTKYLKTNEVNTKVILF